MKTYQDIYLQLSKSSKPGLLSSAWPRDTDDLLREQGIEVQGHDSVQVSIASLLVYYAMKLNELEGRLNDMRNNNV